MNTMENANLIKLEHFFDSDIKVKKEMYNIAPPFDNEYTDKDSLCKYADNLEDSLKYIFSELKCNALNFFGENSLILNHVIELEKNTKEKFYSCGFDIQKLRKFYKDNISNMDKNFIDAVKKSCVGYSLFKNLPINKANSINETLHLMHSCITNNEGLLQSIPVCNQKNNLYNYPIVLRGKSSNAFQKLFTEFPSNLDVSYTDMVAINENKMLMMVRDRGHALSIEITLKNDIAKIEYFIPKLCNIDMINSLPGINHVNSQSVGATGKFETNVSNLSNSIYDFISKVPTDRDMINANKTR